MGKEGFIFIEKKNPVKELKKNFQSVRFIWQGVQNEQFRLGHETILHRPRKLQCMNSMQTCNSVTFYFMNITNFLILTGSVFCQKMIRAVNRGAVPKRLNPE